MKRRTVLGSLAAAVLALSSTVVAAQEKKPIRIGVITEMSGPFADYGRQVQTTIEAFQKAKGDTVDGHKVEIIYRDTTGPNPEVSRRAAQELVSVEKVDFLAGFGLSPNAMGAAPIATASKTPMIIMNAAATSSIVMRSPYIVRASFTLPQVSAPLAAWAAENDIKTVYTLVSDYGPGLDSEKAFIKAFEAAGGKVLGSVRAPMANPEFGPYLQRASDAKPDAIFAFVPSGDTGVQLLKAYEQRGLKDQGIQLITTGDITDDVFLDRIGDVALGLVTSHHYSMAHDSPENKELIKAYQDVHGPDARVNFYMAATWDGMNMMYDIIRELDGNIDGDKAVELAKNMKITSPRGPIEFDENRDVVQNVYIRRVEKVDGKLYNVEFDTIPMVKDPGKEE
ncbi:ABC transporter substrate-binding protein [Pusillimonas sp. DMV24BSW_D]|uniref:ABC transporter substrate-binding protein n=1 Tax=Neopusillimonas aestuarii TaxID=2716226 RepID=UPI000C65511A|nr:ABC transporter substrate-binding protein [Pusillimonas sp. DMV24BSW_D]MAL01730.1 ABC transporter substrate-binding protein [Alcaligenaceae bacterium]QIM47738.1 ABC transporter substrate-binding protein [Pusillimonas sp. DMV24BSW_D]